MQEESSQNTNGQPRQHYEAFSRVEIELPRFASAYGGSNNVFSDGWGERLIRIQFSRFYNQAVIEYLLSIGETECFVPHFRLESNRTLCFRSLAGRNHLSHT